jgi:hypothetical protein
MFYRHQHPDQVITRGEYPTISDEKLHFLGDLFGLTPSFHATNGQPLAEASQALRPEAATPDFEADAEFIDRELFLGQ